MKPIPPSSDRIRTPIVVALVAAIHLLAFGGASLLQGCATRAPRTGSNSSSAIASSRTPFAENASARTPASAIPAVSSTDVSSPSARTPSASLPAGMVTMPPRKGDASAAPAVKETPSATGSLKTFTPPPFVPVPGSVKTPAAAPKVPANSTGTQKYVVQAGESLSVIAQKHGLKSRDLMELNGIADANKVRAGQTLLVPANAKTPASAIKPAGSVETKPPLIKTPEATTGAAPIATPLVNAGGSGTYKVKAGDALSKIAKQFGTTTAELRKLNNLSSDNIRVEQTLKLPGTASSGAALVASPMTPLHPGTKVPSSADSKKATQSEVESILGHDPARPAATGTPGKVEEALEAEIPDVTPSTLIPAGTSGITLKPTEYKVLPGDNVGKLAVIFLSSEAEIRRLNGLGPSQEVKAGDTILIPPPKDP